jgi:pilus assembly protein CpaB
MVIVLGFACLVGLVASFLVYRIVSQLAAPAPTEAMDQVVVATANLTMAETVTPQHIKLVAWPRASVPAGAIRNLKDAEGRVARSSITAGEPLIEGKLASDISGRGGIMPMLVPEGRRGVAVKVDDASRDSGFILPNSHVDVLVSMPRPGTSERIAKVILQDIVVLAAGQIVEMRDNKPVTVNTVTLSLTPDQAEQLAIAQTEGRIMLVTRNLRDKEIVSTSGATQATVLSGASPGRPVAAGPAPVRVSGAPLPPPAVESHHVTLIRGGRVTEMEFVRGRTQQWVERGR